jgi:hypothetical protein
MEIQLFKKLSFFIFVSMTLSFFSLYPAISLLKLLSFYFIASAILLGIASRAQSPEVGIAWLHATWISVLILSSVILFFPEVGYFRDRQGFQGVMNHPQAFGIFLTPLMSYLLANFFQSKRFSLGFFLVTMLVGAMLFLTRARTGPVSILLGLMLLLFFRVGFFLFAFRWLLQHWVLLILFGIFFTGLFAVFGLTDEAMVYFFKNAEIQSISGSFEESRGFIISQAISNILNHPLVGIGFGVANSETHEFIVATDSLTGLPIGAATEKANLPIAVLEEVGVIGLLAFFIFFIPFLRIIANCISIPLAFAALTSIGTNIAEMTFFSMAGFGIYTWIICSLAIGLGQSHNLLCGKNAGLHENAI